MRYKFKSKMQNPARLPQQLLSKVRGRGAGSSSFPLRFWTPPAAAGAQAVASLPLSPSFTGGRLVGHLEVRHLR